MPVMQMLAYIAVLSITPGPNNLTCLYLGARKGFKGSFRFITASMLSLFVKSVLCGLLNMALADIVPKAVEWLKWFGAAYMLYLAYHMAVSGWKDDDSGDTGADGSFMSGVFLQILNAKSWIGALSIFAVYVIPFNPSFSAVLAASFAFFGITLICSLIWSAFGTILRGFISKYKKSVGVIMGLSLVYCAVTAVL